MSNPGPKSHRKRTEMCTAVSLGDYRGSSVRDEAEAKDRGVRQRWLVVPQYPFPSSVMGMESLTFSNIHDYTDRTKTAPPRLPGN